MENAVLNVTDAAYFLRCRERTIIRLTREGRIPYRRLGRRLLFLPAELDLWLSQLPGVSVADAVAAQHTEHEARAQRRRRRTIALEATA